MKTSKKEIVEALMTFVGNEKRVVKGKECDYLIYKCPKPTCLSERLSFQANTGYQNPYAHLRSCYGKGKSIVEQDNLSQQMYDDARKNITDDGWENWITFQK